LQHRGVQRGFDNAREKARKALGKGYSHDDRKPVTFHDPRHAFASRVASRGVPVEVLTSIMGHANVGITQGIYMHLYGREEAEQRFREAMNGVALVGKSLASTDQPKQALTGQAG
jgi:integrase